MENEKRQLLCDYDRGQIFLNAKNLFKFLMLATDADAKVILLLLEIAHHSAELILSSAHVTIINEICRFRDFCSKSVQGIFRACSFGR